MTGGPVLFTNVPFHQATAYPQVAPSTYDLEARPAQVAYARTGLMPELPAVYHLLGDPALVIR